MEAITSCCAPIFVCPSMDAPPCSVNDNGTCGFFDTGTGKVLITAQHVIQDFRNKKALNPNAVLAINVGPGNTIALSELRLVDEEPTFLDIAVLDFPHLDTCGPSCSKRYFPVRQFPPPLPKDGEALSLVGYPGILRKSNELAGSFSPVSIGYTISSVSERQIVLSDHSGDRRVDGEDIGPLEKLLGGFSGSPGYVWRRDGLHMVGFLRAGSKASASPVGLPGVILLSPSHYLMPDGHLDRTRMPCCFA